MFSSVLSPLFYIAKTAAPCKLGFILWQASVRLMAFPELDFSLQVLRVFEAAARLQGFTAAARELGMTQSAVSQNIRGLEAQLGVPLFRRIYRGAELTREGEQLFHSCRESFSGLNETLLKIKASHQRQRIHVATDASFAAFWLIPGLSDFYRQYGETEVQVTTVRHPSEALLHDVDFIICSGSQADSAWPGHLLFRECVCPVISPALLDGRPLPTTPEELKEFPLLTLESPSSDWFTWPEFFAFHGGQTVPVNTFPLMTIDNYTLLIQSVIAGQGVGLGWFGLIDSYLEKGVLVAAESLIARSQRGYWLQEARELSDNPAAAQFLRWMLERSESGTDSAVQP